MVNKTFSGQLTAVDVGAKVDGVEVKIDITGGVIDTIYATTDIDGIYTVTKDYVPPVDPSVDITAVASVVADTVNDAAISVSVVFKIFGEVVTLLKRALSLLVS